MKLEELIRKVRDQINARINVRNDYAKELDELRGAESPDAAKVEELRSKKASADAEITALREQLEAYERELEADAAVQRLQSKVGAAGAPEDKREHEERFAVNEKRTYSQESDPRGNQFLADVAADFLGIRAASERLSRHMAEEMTERGDQLQRGITTVGSPGLVVPQYLVDMYQPKARAGRKLADQMRKHTLPDQGMTVYIPRKTAGTAVAEQANELDTVTEVDPTDELIPVKVRTAAGSSTISRQAVERGAGTEEITFEDLVSAHNTALDSMLINSATWGLLAVANAVTYTSATPTAKDFYSKINGAMATVEDLLLDLDEGDVFTLMRGRRWAWLKNQSTQEHPFIQAATIPVGAFGVSLDTSYADGVRGYMPDGSAVVTDNNLPSNLGTGTNEDVAVVVARQEAHLWEDPNAPMFIRAETGPSMKKLGIDLVLYSYFAAIFNRVVDGAGKSVHQKITGTGLSATVF